ncbi:TolB family protein [Fimbriimonas ginsengisoli]|uniref:WD40 domain-containing protein n=1 Tax=Fimbriimonas ginsengisoli Gsoil 348 TaxID=661478 RepID=A0A068NQM5_FIMGI|nr:PD40 domain-containing protein [Fimbriimonas ginsengisoli]AIE83904.1 WD40 domain-containing protein [Fimbriimonas ginsengisoli Gsoil 348]
MSRFRLFTIPFLVLCAVASRAQSLSNIVFEPPSVSPGQSATGYIYMTSNAPTGGVTVTLSVDKAGFTVPASVTIAAGTSTKAFPMTTTTAATGTATITATGGGVTRKILFTALSAGVTQYFERYSVSSSGGQGTLSSGEPAKFLDGDSRKISADGRFVVFSSNAPNLVAKDSNQKMDVFLRDRLYGTTVKVSQRPNGTESDGNSYQPCISADGNWVAFVSEASSLIAANTTTYAKVILWRRINGQLTLASCAPGGSQANKASYQPSISADGHYVAYMSYASDIKPGDTNGVGDIYVYDRVALTNTRASAGDFGEADSESLYPSISSDGRYVAFESNASNLVANDLNGSDDIFVRDMVANTTERVSVTTSGLELDGFSFCPSISNDGNVVTFATYGRNPDLGLGGSSDRPGSALLVRDRQAAVTTVIALPQTTSDYIEPTISGNGRFISFLQYNYTTGTLGTGYIFDRTLGNQVSNFPTTAWDVSFNTDGSRIVFTDFTRNLVPGDTNGKDDVFTTDALAQRPVSIDFVNASDGPTILGGDSATLQVTLRQPAKAGGEKVFLTGGNTFGSFPASVTVPAGAMTATFVFTAAPDAYGGFVPVTCTAAGKSTTLTIETVGSKMTLDTPTVPSGTATVTGRIRLARAPNTQLTYTLSKQGGGPVGITLPASVLVSPGETVKTFDITIGGGSGQSGWTIKAVCSQNFGESIMYAILTITP